VRLRPVSALPIALLLAFCKRTDAHELDDLKDACEEMVAKDFEICSQHPDLVKLSASQLARLLKRSDLGVSREEAVLKGIFKWFSVSKDSNMLISVQFPYDFTASPG